MREQIVTEENAQVADDEDRQVIDKEEPLELEINVQIKSKKRARTTTKNKQVECKVCLREMRSDNLKRHMLKHIELNTLDEDETYDEIKHRKKMREEDLPIEDYCNTETTYVFDPILFEKQIMVDDLIYTRKIERGKIITNILQKGNAREDSLSKDNREVLQIYRKQMSRRELSNVELRPWQQQLMENISTPSDREIIWIIGQKGNEGKTWFQEYIESFYGYARVVRLDLKMKTAHVLHVLTKRPLCTTDIFLFNEPRAVNHESCNYSILESIKDGTAVSSK